MITEWHKDGIFPSHGWEVDSGSSAVLMATTYGSCLCVTVPWNPQDERPFEQQVTSVPAWLADLFERTAAELRALEASREG